MTKKKRLQFFHKNGLTICLGLLFMATLFGQSVAGHRLYNQTQAAHARPGLDYADYLLTGTFLDGVFSNWQAAILQLGSLIFFSVFLIQRGATHSKKTDKRRHHRKLWHRGVIYENSLSLAFLALFLLAFAAHFVSGAAANNHRRVVEGLSPVTMEEFFCSAQFWFITLQTWQAEYFAIALYLVLSIFLRQEGSPESKPVDAPDTATGVADK
jgi:Domain of unknown function (DUF6766)